MNSGSNQLPRWVQSTNTWTDAIILVVLSSVMWWVLTLLGLVVLGIGPASAAMASVIRDHREHRAVRVVPDMWSAYRRSFRALAPRISPLQILTLLALVAAILAYTGQVPAPWMTFPMAALSVLVAGWLLAASTAAITVPRIQRQDVLVSWRVALLTPGAVPLASIAVILTALVLAIIATLLPPVGLLLAPGLLVWTGQAVLGTRLQRLLDKTAGIEETTETADEGPSSF